MASSNGKNKERFICTEVERQDDARRVREYEFNELYRCRMRNGEKQMGSQPRAPTLSNLIECGVGKSSNEIHSHRVATFM